MADDINTEFTEEITCPYCGWKHTYLSQRYDGDGDEGSTNCVGCNGGFQHTTFHLIRYSTTKSEDK